MIKGSAIILLAVGCTFLIVAVAFANPGMLPSHPGYPAGGKSPVTGQSLANDSGQTNASGGGVAAKAAVSHDSAAMNQAKDPNRMRIKKSEGAGLLPQVDGALNNVEVNPTGAQSIKK